MSDDLIATVLCQDQRVTVNSPLDLVSLQWWISYLLDNYRREPGHVLIEVRSCGWRHFRFML